MNSRLLWGAALLLPLVGFGYSWAFTHLLAQQGEEWLIPVQGYDPRDLLRGHFIQYRYDWPVEKKADAQSGADGELPGSEIGYASAICIEGKAPNIVRASAATEAFGAIDDVMRASARPNEPAQRLKKDCAIIARATLGTRDEVRGLESGILYVSQTKAPALEEKLRDQKLQGMIRVRIREDGVMRPIAIEFRVRRPSAPASEN